MVEQNYEVADGILVPAPGGTSKAIVVGVGVVGAVELLIVEDGPLLQVELGKAIVVGVGVVGLQLNCPIKSRIVASNCSRWSLARPRL